MIGVKKRSKLKNQEDVMINREKRKQFLRLLMYEETRHIYVWDNKIEEGALNIYFKIIFKR